MNESGIARVFVTDSPERTLELGRAIGSALTGGVCVALIGRLGAGKTWLTKGIALGNGLEEASDVTSPTFTLINEYKGSLHLYHIDAYRLDNPAQLASLGLDEMFDHGNAVVLEWADRVESLWPDDTIRIEIEPTSENKRRFFCCATNSIAQAVLGAIEWLDSPSD